LERKAATPVGKATAENPAGSGFTSEEVEALPTESDRLKWKSTVLSAKIWCKRLFQQPPTESAVFFRSGA